VLLYHAFGDEPSRFVVGRRVFARQMRLLSLLRFRVVPYGELVAALGEGRVPRRTVALTIDDGYAEIAEIAPILERHGFGATVFLISGRLGGVNNWSSDPLLHGRPTLSVEEAVRLRARGIELGAHTRSHVDLRAVDGDTLTTEVEGSRRELEEALGEPMRVFAYPYGGVDERVAEAVRAAGFASACTVVSRRARIDDDPFLIPRIEVKRSDSLLRFLLKVVRP